jgi:hypothetical protein
MLSQLTIPKQNQTKPLAIDRQRLYQIGLEHIQRLSGRIWTDYNVHDPGLTTLELLCYALTDLGYRASFPIADLLASESDNRENMQRQFFTARQILPNRPLTLLDYRKLLIDLDGVQNAWLQPIHLTYYADMLNGQLLRDNPHIPGIVDVNLAGLYGVKIEYTNTIDSVIDKQQIILAVTQKLQANRNLCEDFVRFTAVEVQQFQLCAELELTPNADVAQVNADILSQVQGYLSPTVRFYSLTEMLTRKKNDGMIYSVDEIFDGPALEHGFIDDDELEAADLRTEIRLSDIISIIMDIAGVQAVRDIVINPQGLSSPLANKWLISVETGKQAKLDQEHSRLVFYKRNMPVVPRTFVNQLSTINIDPTINDLEIPLGTYRKLDSYYSYQNHFPAIYGLSEVGLSSTADAERQALAYQLKSYLLFFDQIMANYFAQLSQVKNLFSTDADLQSTYFYQMVDSFANYSQIYRSNFSDNDFIQLSSFVNKLRFHPDAVSQLLWNNISAAVQGMIEDYTEDITQIAPLKTSLAAQLNQIIQDPTIYAALRLISIDLSTETRQILAQTPPPDTSLISRMLLQDAYPGEIAKWNQEEPSKFADRRNRFLDHLISRFAERFHDFAYIMQSRFNSSPASVIQYKCEFLQNYPVISSDRGLAYNYALTDDQDLWDSTNISGLEKRLTKLLGIADDRRRDLNKIDYNILSITAAEFGFQIQNRAAQISRLINIPLYANESLAIAAVKDVIRYGQFVQNYQPKIADGRYFFSIVNDNNQEIARSSTDFATEDQRNNEITQTITWLNSSIEGMYLIENILLRPEPATLLADQFLPICPNIHCTDCSEADPYSYHVQIILPGDDLRGGDIEFRRFAEELIRAEIPAHILPKICWVSKGDMVVLAKYYRDWLYLKAGVNITQAPEKLRGFIEQLFAVKNIYPPQKLRDCDSVEDLPKFILGSTALGTGRENLS